jgi:formylglycine-generating enzyme required for sulfatase activity
MMGSDTGENSEKPIHRVGIKNFYMSKTEITVGQYKQCVDAGVCSEPHWDDGSCYTLDRSGWKKGILRKEFRKENQPVVCVDWKQARKFAKWVGGDLPSEAQWEYASRLGGKDMLYPWGNTEPTCDIANFNYTNFNYKCHDVTTPVCSKIEGNTVQGLCDMGGNVWEWVLDEWHDSYIGAPSNDIGWCSDMECDNNSSVSRVGRGGSWNDDASNLRSAYRSKASPSSLNSHLGFRVAHTRPMISP